MNWKRNATYPTAADALLVHFLLLHGHPFFLELSLQLFQQIQDFVLECGSKHKRTIVLLENALDSLDCLAEFLECWTQSWTLWTKGVPSGGRQTKLCHTICRTMWTSSRPTRVQIQRATTPWACIRTVTYYSRERNLEALNNSTDGYIFVSFLEPFHSWCSQIFYARRPQRSP